MYSTFSRVVSRESFRITLTHADLHYLPICACDIQNACLQAHSSEKHCAICGSECALENVGKHEIVIHTLYRGKSSGADYWSHARSSMEEMAFS